MLEIKNLFDITDDNTDSEEHSFSLPSLSPPGPNSSELKKDIESVTFCYANPSLRGGFLDSSHESVKDIFKKYCKEANYRVDWAEMKNLLKIVKKANVQLKNKYKRPRPKNLLVDRSPAYESIHDMDSYSYPSGHTSTAYFIAGILASQFPDARSDLETIAALIGQSRIENAVHYPSDVSYGRLVGEYCVDYCLEDSGNYNLDKQRKKKHNKKFALFLRDQDGNLNKTAKSIANFIYSTLQIEGLDDKVSYNECLSAAKKLMTASEDKYLSDVPLIKSQCAGLRESYFLKSYSPEGCIRIHKQMSKHDLDKGSPGEFRNYSHYSPAGIQYCEPDYLFSCLKKIANYDNPILRHALFEWVHPFMDGNGRTGRIILCQDMNYDFNAVNRVISNKYIENLNSFYFKNDIAKSLA